MAYLHVCDRCGTNLDRTRSYYKVRVEIHTNTSISISPKSKDYCMKCFDEIKELASSTNASVSYNTPGAR